MNRLSTPIPEIFFGYTAGHVGKTATFAAGFGFLYGGKELKGNPVKIRNSHCQIPKSGGKAARTRGKSEDLPILLFWKAFEEKAEKRGALPAVCFSLFLSGLRVRKLNI